MIFNTDQGSQFTSGKFTGALERNGVRIRMDGRGRLQDNILIGWDRALLGAPESPHDLSSTLCSLPGPHQPGKFLRYWSQFNLQLHSVKI